MHLKFKQIPWEIVIAFVINSFLLVLFLVCKITYQPNAPNPPVEITVDISDFTPPTPKEIKTPAPSAENNGSAIKSITKMNDATDEKSISSSSIRDFVPTSLPSGSTMPSKNSVEYTQELERIEHGIRTFDGINQINTGLAEGSLPAGHHTGASFQGRGNTPERRKLLKRHGGNEKTESSVERALAYLASIQNPNGSWGSPDSFKTGDTAALSSLALLAFFSHGENFQSAKYGDTIRRGCDFLIELSNTPSIELAGKGFGHAILTYSLAEGFAVTGSLSLRHALEKRIKYILSHQNSFGSFAINYDNSPQAPLSAEQMENPLYKEIVPGEPNCDLSLLGWHIQAIVAAKNAGIQMENLDKTLALTLEALVKIHQADKGGFSQGINMKRFPADDNMTPVGLLSMYLLNAGNSSPARRAERLLEKIPLPLWKQSSSFPLYRWYYQTQALFQAEKGRGKRWKIWNENLKKELLKGQTAEGSWPMPGGDNSFRIKNKNDLAIYSTSLCALMLQVYYRYLPSYSIAESPVSSKNANDFDLGGAGLISRLPGGADPMAAVILGVGTDNMPPIKFGVFNGMPQCVDSPLVEGEFQKLASLRSTIAVHKPEEWPQTLQVNQRIALFFDELLPRNFKGHMRLLLGCVGSDKNARQYHQSLEIVLNGKRLYNSCLLRRKQLIEIVIPNDIMQPYGNILQIRNNGKSALAFDAAELASVNKVGGKLFLLAGRHSRIPADLQKLFCKNPPDNAKWCKLSSQTEDRQLLAEISTYDQQKSYIGEYSASGSEYMGNEFQLHYLRQTGREIVDWIAGGGSGVKINEFMTGGKFYDTIFHEEYPAASAFRQAAKLFEGTPRKLSSQIYPKYGEKPALFLSSAASYNAPGIATIVIARRFPIQEESEVIALVPWSGATEMIIERGFLSEKSPFSGFAAKIENERKEIPIQNNIFRYSTVFPELTVIRLIRKGTRELPKTNEQRNHVYSQKITFDHNAVSHQLPSTTKKMNKSSIRQAGGYVAVFGQNVSFVKIPATIPENKFERFIPVEKESLCVTFNVQARTPKRFDSAYLALGNTASLPDYLVFDIYTRVAGQKKHSSLQWVTFRFALNGKLYASVVTINRWQKIVLPLKGVDPAWQYLRILEPTGFFDKNLQSVSFEINDVSTYSQK